MAGIIKSGTFHGVAGSVTPSTFNFEDIHSRADLYLASVRHQAEQILARAKEQVATVESQARERGRLAARDEAERAAREHVDHRMKSLLPALEQAVTAIQLSRQTWLRHWEQNTVRLATAIAERVIRRELAQRPEITVDWVREALELVTGESRITVHLHPDDHETLGDRVQQLVQTMCKVGAAAIQPDPTLERGGCRVVTDFGSIDQQLTAQLERIQEDLTVP